MQVSQTAGFWMTSDLQDPLLRPEWMKESSDSNVCLFSRGCRSAQMCTLCLNQRPSACLAKIKTFTNSDLSHSEAMTSFTPHLGPCHLVKLVEPITDG